ncbi:MAG: hypothetical protein R3C61_29430 [Bacteroidia bacterium]
MVNDLEKVAESGDKESVQLLFSLFFNLISSRHNLVTDKIPSFSPFRRLYKIGMKHKFLLAAGYLKELHYFTMIIACLKDGDTEDARYYLKTWKNYLLEDIREEMAQLMEAIICFWEKKYKEVLNLTRNLRMAHPFNECQLRIYNFKAIFEIHYDPENGSEWKNEREYMCNLCKTLEAFARSQQNLSEVTRERFINTANTFRKLIRAHKRKQLHALRDYVEGEVLMDEKEWIIEKIHIRLNEAFEE